MKRMMMLAVAALFAGTLAHAADAENSGKETVDTSKNPLTGTVTKTKKAKRKVKAANGAEANATVTEKTKTHSDGKTEKSVETSADSTNK